jgi:hypothetical protein
MNKLIHYLQVKICKLLYLDFCKARALKGDDAKKGTEEALKLYIDKYGKK